MDEVAEYLKYNTLEIREKEYVEKFRHENKDKKVLAVAICYDSKSKEHKCKIEEI